MLIAFKVSNFRSFTDNQELKLVASKDKTLSDTLLGDGREKMLSVIAIYGANASGKSNLIKAMQAVRYFVLNSATSINLGDPVPNMRSFQLNKDWRSKPSCFEIEVMINRNRFNYSFRATTERVHSETLHVQKDGGNRVLRYSREYDASADRTKWEFKRITKQDEKLLIDKTRDNMLLLSRAAEQNLGGEFRDLFLWFKNSFRTLDLSQPADFLMRSTAKHAHDSSSFRERLLPLLRDADFGISDFTVREEPFSFPNSMPTELKRAMAAFKKHLGGTEAAAYAVKTTHVDSDLLPVHFSMVSDESNGTQRFFALAGQMLLALERGATLVVDELECSMHPRLTRKFVELFRSSKVNIHGAQLIFATHDVSLMDADLLRRDQVWFAEKKSCGDTELFSLYDVGQGDDKPRKGEAYQKRYLLGHYGAVGKLGPTFEDLELPLWEEGDPETDIANQDDQDQTDQ